MSRRAWGPWLPNALSFLRGRQHVVQAREQGGAIPHGIQRSHFDEALQRTPIYSPLIDPDAKIIKFLVWAVNTLCGDSLCRRRPHILHRGKPEVDRALFDGKIGFALVHTRRRHGNFQPTALAHRFYDLVRVAELGTQDRCHIFGGIVGLEIGGLVRNSAVARSVCLIESVPREGLEVVKDGFRETLRQTLCHCALDKSLAMLLQLVRNLLADGIAELVCLGQGVAGHRLRHGHHVLLIDHDAVGALQYR